MWIVYVVIGVLLVAALLLLAGIKPGRRRLHLTLETERFAHRGLHSGDSRVPENSLAAFRQAAEAGFAVELDIQLTADRQVVVFHDATLTRMCGVDRRVDELTAEELRQFPLLGSDQHIPLLAEVLEVLNGVPVLCECKTMRSFTDTAICEVAWPLLAAYPGTVWVESFNPLLIRWFYKNQPRVPRGILSMKFDKTSREVSPTVGKILSVLLTNFLTKPDFIAYRFSDRRRFAFQLCRRLFRPLTLAWTIHNKEEEEEALHTGFDGVIFEGYSPRLPTNRS